MAVLAPMPRASAETAAIVKPGLLMKRCRACLTSFQKSPMVSSEKGLTNQREQDWGRSGRYGASVLYVPVDGTGSGQSSVSQCFVMSSNVGATAEYFRAGQEADRRRVSYACLRYR